MTYWGVGEGLLGGGGGKDQGVNFWILDASIFSETFKWFIFDIKFLYFHKAKRLNC